MEEQPTIDLRQEILQLVRSAGECGESDTYPGKRRGLRVCDGLQLEMISDPRRGGPAAAVSMHNVSEGGLAFWARRRIEPGTSLYMREFSADNSRQWLPVRVTHCTVGIRGFLVGAAFLVE